MAFSRLLRPLVAPPCFSCYVVDLTSGFAENSSVRRRPHMLSPPLHSGSFSALTPGLDGALGPSPSCPCNHLLSLLHHLGSFSYRVIPINIQRCCNISKFNTKEKKKKTSLTPSGYQTFLCAALTPKNISRGVIHALTIRLSAFAPRQFPSDLMEPHVTS